MHGFTDGKIVLTESLLDDPFNEMVNQFKPILADLKSTSNLQSFVYKLDLPEKKYTSYILEYSEENIFITDIIVRSAQKVFLRHHFSDRINQP